MHFKDMQFWRRTITACTLISWNNAVLNSRVVFHVPKSIICYKQDHIDKHLLTVNERDNQCCHLNLTRAKVSKMTNSCLASRCLHLYLYRHDRRLVWVGCTLFRALTGEFRQRTPVSWSNLEAMNSGCQEKTIP